MIKVWKGIEKEGIGRDSEILTLFICSDQSLSYKFIQSILDNNTDVQGLYFGAGRQTFAGMDKQDWDKTVLYCMRRRISIIVEVSPTMLEVFSHLYSADIVTFVVSYYNAPKNMKNLYFKTDDFITTRIFTSQKDVDITEVEDNMYSDDIVVYEED